MCAFGPVGKNILKLSQLGRLRAALSKLGRMIALASVARNEVAAPASVAAACMETDNGAYDLSTCETQNVELATPNKM